MIPTAGLTNSALPVNSSSSMPGIPDKTSMSITLVKAWQLFACQFLAYHLFSCQLFTCQCPACQSFTRQSSASQSSACQPFAELAARDVEDSPEPQPYKHTPHLSPSFSHLLPITPCLLISSTPSTFLILIHDDITQSPANRFCPPHHDFARTSPERDTLNHPLNYSYALCRYPTLCSKFSNAVILRSSRAEEHSWLPAANLISGERASDTYGPDHNYRAT